MYVLPYATGSGVCFQFGWDVWRVHAQAQLQHQLALQHHQQMLAAEGGAGGAAAQALQQSLFQRLAASAAAQHAAPKQDEQAPGDHSSLWPDVWPEPPANA